MSGDSKIEVTQTILKSTVHYLDELDKELAEQRRYHDPEPTEKEVTVLNRNADISIRNGKKGWGIWRK